VASFVDTLVGKWAIRQRYIDKGFDKDGDKGLEAALVQPELGFLILSVKSAKSAVQSFWATMAGRRPVLWHCEQGPVDLINRISNDNSNAYV
jgi:hypothetical protein